MQKTRLSTGAILLMSSVKNIYDAFRYSTQVLRWCSFKAVELGETLLTFQDKDIQFS